MDGRYKRYCCAGRRRSAVYTRTWLAARRASLHTRAAQRTRPRSRTGGKGNTRVDVREFLVERLHLLSQHAHSDCHGLLTLRHYCVHSVVAIKAQGLIRDWWRRQPHPRRARARAGGGGVSP